MSLLLHLRSPALSFIQTLLSLLLSLVSLSSSHWFVGSQKVPKPLCSPTRRLRCTPVPGMTDSSAQFSWETGDDRFIFPTFHTGLWTTCEENIYTDAWVEFVALVSTAGALGVAWLAFTCCMSSGVSTLNIYTKTFLMLGRKHQRVSYPCKNFTFPPQYPLVSPLSPYISSPLPPPPPTCPAPLSPALSLLRPPSSSPVTLFLSPVSSDEDFSPL
ncbi:Germ cell-specific gene 1 protein [Triplophysa tibetana]|uniref:Germ cell-specific gene 1 protein n=1 Tax=Triplophysa tibetana TaxID=1572043 RepID=A0A5A9ND88_9TELE|nr:Germ cell-specific gene 1 protein [Triplophysa tibetana]